MNGGFHYDQEVLELYKRYEWKSIEQIRIVRFGGTCWISDLLEIAVRCDRGGMRTSGKKY
jgi:hypothetical protein